MAKKKKSKKKFHSKKTAKKRIVQNQPTAAEPAQAEGIMPGSSSSVGEVTVAKSAKIVQTKNSKRVGKKSLANNGLSSDSEAYDFVKTDVKTSFIIFGSIIGALVILWLLFEYTGLGSAIYHLVKI